MKNHTTKKLFPFMLLASGIFSLTVANAQIIYTDVVPDSAYTITFWGTQTYNLDINGDGTSDFLINADRPHPIYLESPVKSSVSITPQVNNAFITSALSTVKNLVFGDSISSSQSWQDSTSQYLKWYQLEYVFPEPVVTEIGEWDSAVNCYIGLQLISDGQTYYGWVRMDVKVSVDSASMTIKDYAYNTIPDQPILAGLTTATGITENISGSLISLFPNPAKNHLTIALGSNNPKIELTIADITGKITYSTTASETQKIEVNTKDFAAGIYIVQIHSGEFIGTKKLVVVK